MKNGVISKEDTLVLVVNNHDDKPIHIKGITVKYAADELIFDGSTGTAFTLQFGQDDKKTPPVYDIVKYKDEILKNNIDRLTIKHVSIDDSNPKEERSKEEPASSDYTMVFNIVLIGVAVALGLLILLKLRKSTGEG